MTLDCEGRPLAHLSDDAANWELTSGAAAVATSSTDPSPAVRFSITQNIDAINHASLDMSQAGLSFWVKVEDANLTSLAVYLYAGRPYGAPRFSVANAVSGVIVGRWHRVILPMAALTRTNGAADRHARDIRSIQLAPLVSGAADFQVADFRIHQQRLPPGVVWQFDDARVDTYTTAFPILRDSGHAASISTPGGLVGNAGKMTLTQLQEVRDVGWEIVAHGYNHVDLTGLSLTDLRAELRNSRDWLSDNGFASGAGYHALPFSAFNATVLREVQRYFAVNRSAGDLTASMPGVSDPGRLLFKNVTNSETVTTVKGWLDKAATGAGVATLLFHSIEDTVSDASSQFQTDKFREVVEYADTVGLRSYVPSDLWP